MLPLTTAASTIFFGSCLVCWIIVEVQISQSRAHHDGVQEERGESNLELGNESGSGSSSSSSSSNVNDSNSTAMSPTDSAIKPGITKSASVAAVKARAAKRLQPASLQLSSLRDLLRRFSEVGAYMLLCWVCENRPLHAHMQKGELAYLFWPLFGIFMVAAIATVRKNKVPGAEILNREQTEEWKGWMQYLFLAYHYFHYTKVYNAVRVFIAAYIWMTVSDPNCQEINP